MFFFFLGNKECFSDTNLRLIRTCSTLRNDTNRNVSQEDDFKYHEHYQCPILKWQKWCFPLHHDYNDYGKTELGKIKLKFDKNQLECVSVNDFDFNFYLEINWGHWSCIKHRRFKNSSTTIPPTNFFHVLLLQKQILSTRPSCGLSAITCTTTYDLPSQSIGWLVCRLSERIDRLIRYVGRSDGWFFCWWIGR